MIMSSIPGKGSKNLDAVETGLPITEQYRKLITNITTKYKHDAISNRRRERNKKNLPHK